MFKYIDCFKIGDTSINDEEMSQLVELITVAPKPAIVRYYLREDADRLCDALGTSLTTERMAANEYKHSSETYSERLRSADVIMFTNSNTQLSLDILDEVGVVPKSVIMLGGISANTGADIEFNTRMQLLTHSVDFCVLIDSHHKLKRSSIAKMWLRLGYDAIEATRKYMSISSEFYDVSEIGSKSIGRWENVREGMLMEVFKRVTGDKFSTFETIVEEVVTAKTFTPIKDECRVLTVHFRDPNYEVEGLGVSYIDSNNLKMLKNLTISEGERKGVYDLLYKDFSIPVSGGSIKDVVGESFNVVSCTLMDEDKNWYKLELEST